MDKRNTRDAAIVEKRRSDDVRPISTDGEEFSTVNAELTLQNVKNAKENAALVVDNQLLKKLQREIRGLNTKLGNKVIKRTTQYAFISQINQNIVHNKNPESLFRECCIIANEVGKFQMAWIGLYDGSNENKIDVAAHCGIPAGTPLHTYLEKHGLQQDVLRTGKYYLCNNISTEAIAGKWKIFAVENNVRSFIVLPLKRMGIVIGTFNLYSKEYNFFDKQEVALMVEVAGDISFALDLFEKEKKHRATEELIIKNEKRFRALVENGSDAVAILSGEGKVMYISPSILKVLGYTEEEAIKLDIFKLLHPDDVVAMSEVWDVVMHSNGTPMKGHTGRMLHKDGTWRWLEAMVTNMLHEPSVNGIIDNFRDVTQQVEVEMEREFDKNNLNALINTTKDLMWSVDKDLNLVTFNKAFFEVIKAVYNKNIVKGDHVMWLGLDLKEAARFKLFYKRAFAGEEFTEIEYLKIPVECWSQISFYPIRSGNKVVGSACYSRDITNLVKTEESLHKSEMFNKGILNSLNSNIAVVDHKGNIIAVNEAWKRFGDTNSGQSINGSGVGCNYFTECERAYAVGVEIGLAALEGMQDVMAGRRKDLYLEYPCDSPTEKRWFGMRVTKFDSDASLIVVAHNNITERKIAEQDLINTQVKLKQAQALAHMGSWQFDFKTNILQLSDEGCVILGLSPQKNQMSMAMWLNLIHPKDRSLIMKAIKESREAFKDTSFNYRIVRGTGAVRYIYSESKFVFNSNNKAVGLYGILQDITERRKSEDEKEKITTDILRRNKDLEQFSYIVSHNLRAPVANIIGLTELIQNEDLDEGTKGDLVDGISKSVNKLDEVITDLNYILQTKQRVNGQREIVSFSMLMRDITNSIHTLIEKENAIITHDFKSVGKMSVVKTYIHSIFYNLIYNSLKYRQKTVDPVIEVISRKTKNKIILEFKDNGIGIDLAKNGTQVFGMYRRFHTESSEGKGMGLYMVKTQVESIGGQIYIESHVNKGTTFTIELPHDES